MASNRYGQIWHGDHHHINIRFPSTEARLKFQNEFEAYHASHDHEGEIPTFKCVSSKDLKLSTGSRSPQDLVMAETDDAYRITIDGYSWNEIHEYHNPSGWSNYFHYHVPTCCVPPIIVIDREFVDSGIIQRHPLSAVFGDMPADDFQSLLDSVQADGFIDPIVRIYEGQILDGWHRYRAAQELNLIRRLKFQEWNEDEHRDGDPKAFVLARNIERRHLTPGQRAQIAVAFNERFGHGGDRGKMQDCNLKTQQDLADQANVSKRTIGAAVQVEKAGQSEAVIAGEKTAGEVLEEQKAKASAETEAAIAVVKPRFQNAVETWRSLQVERLRKFEHLPVGRTPLIESEYLKTYFELAQPRIPQNTKPTVAHYEGAIECMQDLPVAFAEQLQGRHYRRIIKEWDASVLLSLVERFQSGHILGYPALQTDSDANAVRIRQAIRDHYGFQGRVTTQPFEVLFEITEDAHAVLVQLNPKEWMREGREISWALSVLPAPIDTQEIGTAGTVKDLWAKVSEEMPKWKQRHTGVSYASQSTLIAAYREHTESEHEGAATAEELKGLLKLMGEDSHAYALRVRYSDSDERHAFETARNSYFKARGDLREKIVEKAIDMSAFIEAAKRQYHRKNIAGMFGAPHDILMDGTLTAGIFEDWTGFLRVLSVDVNASAPWVASVQAKSDKESLPLQEALDEMKADTETPTEAAVVPPAQEAEQPPQSQAEREANKLLKRKKQTLKSIWDKRKQAAADYMGDGDTDLNQYLTLEQLEKGFAKHEKHAYCADAFRSGMQRTSFATFNTCLERVLKSDVSIEDLNKELNAINTYAYDILQWEKQNWIVDLIARKKGAQSESPVTAPDAAVPDKEGLSTEFKRIFTLHNRFDPDMVDCKALAETYHLHEDDVRELMERFQRELGALENKVHTELKFAPPDISVEDLADRVEVDAIEVVEAMIAKIQLDEANRPSTPSTPEEHLPLQNALDAMQVSDAETFDWNAVRPDFDPEKHEWLRVSIQRGTNHTTVTKIPTGPAHFTYNSPEKEVVVEKGMFPQEKLREILEELSETFAKWVVSQSE